MKKWVEMLSIPYNKIDQEIVPLIKAMNEHGSIVTTNSCIGHTHVEPCAVIFKITNQPEWEQLMRKILSTNNEFQNANIDVYQWHRLDQINEPIVDWLLEIETHPGVIKDDLLIKLNVITRLISVIHDDKAATLSSDRVNTLNSQCTNSNCQTLDS